MEACKQLLEKMEPVKAKMKNPTWEELVAKCYDDHVLLTAHYQYVLHHLFQEIILFT